MRRGETEQIDPPCPVPSAEVTASGEIVTAWSC